jgi:hypothetical protein
MPKRVDLNNVPVLVGSGYPAPFDKPCAAREVVLITDSGQEILRAGDSARSSLIVICALQ